MMRPLIIFRRLIQDDPVEVDPAVGTWHPVFHILRTGLNFHRDITKDPGGLVVDKVLGSEVDFFRLIRIGFDASFLQEIVKLGV